MQHTRYFNKIIIIFCLLLNIFYAAIPTTNREITDNIDSIDSTEASDLNKQLSKINNPMFGGKIGIGISFDILKASGKWLIKEDIYPYRSANFNGNVDVGAASLIVSYQYIGYKLHFLSDSRLGLGYNLFNDKTKMILSLDELFGYYFPFSYRHGLSIKFGLSFMVATSKTYEVDDYPYYPTTNLYLGYGGSFIGIGSKLGLEYHISNISIGAFFSSYYFYTFPINGDNRTTPHNFNAISKSFPYNVQIAIMLRL